jgi:hypothetical protein
MQQSLRLFCGRKWTDFPYVPPRQDNNGKCVAKSSQEQNRAGKRKSRDKNVPAKNRFTGNSRHLREISNLGNALQCDLQIGLFPFEIDQTLTFRLHHFGLCIGDKFFVAKLAHDAVDFGLRL